jgi:hypothetical protein
MFLGKKVFIRSARSIIDQVFRTETLAKSIVPEPSPVNLPQEVYESENFAQLVPKLAEWVDGKKYCKGSSFHFLL